METIIKPPPTAKHLCRLVDEFLGEDDRAVKAFVEVLERFVDHDRNDDTLDFEAVRNHAVGKSPAYQKFLESFLGYPATYRERAEVTPQLSETVQ